MKLSIKEKYLIKKKFKEYLPVGWVQAQIAALINAIDILIDRVDCFQNFARDTFEFAQLAGLLSAIILQVISTIVGFHIISASQGDTIHIGEFAQTRMTIEVSGSKQNDKKWMNFYKIIKWNFI